MTKYKHLAEDIVNIIKISIAASEKDGDVESLEKLCSTLMDQWRQDTSNRFILELYKVCQESIEEINLKQALE